MPQVFQVLRCYQCLVFQVHQAKKSNKWQCKLCGEKQSIKRHYGIGTAKDCRLHVQKLNGIRGEIDEHKQSEYTDSDDNEEVPVQTIQPKKSKWSEFTEKNEESNTDEKMYLGDTEVVLEVKKKRKRDNFKCPVLKDKNLDTDLDSSFSNNLQKKTVTPTFIKTEKSLTRNHDDEFSNSNHFKECYSSNRNSSNSEPKIHPKQCIEEYTQKKAKTKTFVPPSVKSSSKWAQFTEDDDLNEANDENDVTSDFNIDNGNAEGNPNSQIFALCNDDDLDSVLDI